MKPISLQVSAEYEEIVNRLMAAMGKHNPEGRVISRTHVLRYALRVADGNGSIRRERAKDHWWRKGNSRKEGTKCAR